MDFCSATLLGRGASGFEHAGRPSAGCSLPGRRLPETQRHLDPIATVWSVSFFYHTLPSTNFEHFNRMSRLGSSLDSLGREAMSSSGVILTNRTAPGLLRVLENGTLFFRAIRKSQQGRYVCSAVNRLGQELTATVTLTVHGILST